MPKFINHYALAGEENCSFSQKKKNKNNLESIWSLYCYDTFLNNI